VTSPTFKPTDSREIATKCDAMPGQKPRNIHKAGIRVLKAISASIRIQMLNLMLQQGPLSYTEIMTALRLDATRDAGRFAYHLKSLLKADLIEPDVETKEYRLTDLGRRAIDIADEIEERTYKRRQMLVRTSHLSIEEFDRNKIIHSLVEEASVPTELAQKIAREAEKRLQQFKTRYVSAPLIREIVNTILLEKHFEEYRHKLTRLGLPVHEVTRLIATQGPNVEAVQKAAANAVTEEYTLLNILPRNIADAHLSGSLHLHNLGTWILKPNEIIHSLSYLLQTYKPRAFETALNLLTNVVRNTAAEIASYQSLEEFNTCLAPLAEGITLESMRQHLSLFIGNLNQVTPTPTTISLELSTDKSPRHAFQAQQIALLLLEELVKASQDYPLQNPRIILKVQPEAFTNDASKSAVLEAHKLALETVLVYFANHGCEWQDNATYTASGLRLGDDWHGDWELDTQRTGNLEISTINLPRLSFNAKGDEDKLMELLSGQLELATQALGTKFSTIKKRMRQNLLPSLLRRVGNDDYFRLENSTRAIAFVGLEEAVQTITGIEAADDYGKAFVVTERILEHINGYLEKHSKKPQTRLTAAIVPNPIAAERLARLDAEKYGWKVVKAKGTKDRPYYTDVGAFSLSDKERLEMAEQIHRLTPGGHLAFIEYEPYQATADELLSMTEKLVQRKLGLFAYGLSLVYCRSCGTRSHGTHLKCPKCRSTSIFTLARS
jgi:ribonucleoside-triphosphate reductase